MHPIEPALLAQARALVRSAYGAELAAKASDEFCLAAVRPAEAAVGLETMTRGAEAVAAPPTVLEFALPSEEAEWAPALRRGAARAALEALPDRDDVPPAVVQQVGPAARRIVLTPIRDRFLSEAGAVHDELERAASVLRRGHALEAGAQLERASFADVCWLNRTIRARTDPRAVAEVAADPGVQRIDVPRRLEPDVVETANVVGASEFRAGSGASGAGVIVAVADSEVAARHPGLVGRVVHKGNFTREAFGTPGDHGTAVAGIIASSGEVEGIAPGVTIYNYKVLATNRFLNGDDFDGALAIEQALEDGAHVVNCSWGAGAAGAGTSREARACDAAWALGLTIVKSAGNRGPDGQTLTTPADAAGIIVVGATDRAGKTLEDYSSRGPTASGVNRPHLLAPGGSPGDGIISCLVQGGYGDCGHGTSYAAPHVSGLAALLLDQDPTLDPDELRETLIAACEPLPGLSDDEQGAGVVKLRAALRDAA